MKSHKSFTIFSNPDAVREIRKEVERFASMNGFSEEETGQIGLAVNEAIANVIEHSYKGKTDRKIDIELDMCNFEGKSALQITIRDYGEHVDPDKIQSRNLDEIRPGGLGVHIIKTIMDKVEYSCIPEAGMQLNMIKLLRTREKRTNEDETNEPRRINQ